jgi:hypothetical protein
MNAKETVVPGAVEKATKRNARAKASCALTPSFSAAAIAERYSVIGDLDYFALSQELARQGQAISVGNLRPVEDMLITQAHSLNAIFTFLAARAASNLDEPLVNVETYLRLAFKAQSQSRATLEVLAAIKNPPVVYAQQTNIAHGPQQVNNNAAPPLAYVGKNQSTQTGLLENDHEQRLDSRTSCAAIGSNQTVETVGEVHRTANRRGKSRNQP